MRVEPGRGKMEEEETRLQKRRRDLQWETGRRAEVDPAVGRKRWILSSSIRGVELLGNLVGRCNCDYVQWGGYTDGKHLPAL